MRVLLIGATGLIGSAIRTVLGAAGHEVVGAGHSSGDHRVDMGDPGVGGGPLSGGRRARRGAVVVVVAAALVVAACAPGSDVAPPRTVPFDQAFQAVTTLRLDEPNPPIGELGASSRVPGSDRMLVTDPMLRRILLYEGNGSLAGAFGRAGDDPGGFGALSGAAVGRDGRILISDNQKRLLTFLHPDLSVDTVVRVDAVIGTLSARPEGYVGDMYSGRGGPRLRLIDAQGHLGRAFMPPPAAIRENPYWGSVTGVHVAAVGDRIVGTDGLLYPLRIFDGKGQLLGTLDDPPPSFRRIPVVEAGDLGGPGRLGDFLDSFSTVAGVFGLRDRWLVVVHGGLSAGPTMSFEPEHRSVDVWDLDARRKVYEDVPLPSGSRVLHGGDELALVMSSPPDPWEVRSFRLTPP